MTKLDLIAAIGAASDEDLEHSERIVTRRRRVSTRVLLAAALIALLTGTVFAAPAIYHALFGVKTTPYKISRIFVEEGKPADVRESSLDVSLEVQMSPDAPSVIETCYVPMLPAEQWEPIPLTVNRGSVLSFRKDYLLQWQSAEGEYVIFQQFARPDLTAGVAFYSVCTGFDASYSVSPVELGGYTVQRIVVEPSEKEENGVHAAHPGLQKLYWSDGLYIFVMEVNYSMSDARLAEILESIQPVADPADYVVIEEAPVTEKDTMPSLQSDRLLFPASLPQGYVQADGRRYEDGECFFLWLKEGVHQPTVLEWSVSPAGKGRNDWYRKDWETHAKTYKKSEREVNGTQVLCYESDWQAQLLWQLDGADYTICSVGPGRLTVEELLEIMDGLVAVEDINSVMMY